MAVSTGGASEEGITLNLMPMLDIFSIIITFLLMTFSAEPSIHDSKGVQLPESKTFVSLDEVPAIKVTNEEIIVQNKPVASIRNGKLLDEFIDQGAARPVYEALEEMRKSAEATKGELDDPEIKKKTRYVTMEIDKKSDFLLMKQIMLAGQQAEYTGFKLMVTKPVE